jgi:hypothetical protein
MIFVYPAIFGFFIGVAVRLCGYVFKNIENMTAMRDYSEF